MDTNKEMLKALTSFAKITKQLGVKKTITLLKDITSQIELPTYEQDLQKFIIKTTCDMFGVRRDCLLNPMVSDKAHDARTVCVLLIKKHLQYTHEHTARIFRKTHALVSNANRDYNNKNEDFPLDKVFLAKYRKVEDKIEEFKHKHNENAEDH